MLFLQNNVILKLNLDDTIKLPIFYMNEAAINLSQFGMPAGKIIDVLDSASMGVWRVTLSEGKKPRESASPKMLELLGLERDCDYPEEYIYETWYNGICPEALESVQHSVQKMMAGAYDENTYKWNHPKWGIRYMRCGGVGYKDKNGDQILEGYHYDVTEYMNQHIRETFIVNSLAATYSGIFYIDLKNGTYESYSKNAPHIVRQVPSAGSLAKALRFFADYMCQPCDRDKVMEFNDLSTLNSRLRHRDTISVQFMGTTYEYAEFSYSVCDRDADGSVLHLVATVKDITAQKKEEKRMLEELKHNVEANKAKTVMLQNMTHEIRTPLNAMFGFSQLLCMPDGSFSEAEKNEYYNYIYNSFNMLSMIIDDVLDLTDVEHGNYRVQNSRFAVNQVGHDSVQMAELRKHGRVRMYFTSELPDDYMIESDSRRIQQVLVNLLTNSCKHTVQGEIHLHLSATETPGHLTFSVTDTGEGIPVGKSKEIFQRYKKANDLVQGSGLGLHICCTIAKKLGAEIKLDESYTGGARFLLVL